MIEHSLVNIVVEVKNISVISQGKHELCVSLRCYKEEPDSRAGERGSALTWYDLFYFFYLVINNSLDLDLLVSDQ